MTRPIASIIRIFAVAAIALIATAAHADPIPKEVTDALTQLPTADEAGRQKIYTTLTDKGDARLIPLLKAYRDGTLQLRDGKFLIYGERITIQGLGSVLPLEDALTGEPVKGSDGKPVYSAKQDLSKAIKSPPRSERRFINEVISSLSLLDPDPKTRIQSIRDAGERAARVFLGKDEKAAIADQLARDAVNLQRQLDRDPKGHFAAALREAIMSINLATGDPAAQKNAAADLGGVGSTRASNLLRKWTDAAHARKDAESEAIGNAALARVKSYQSRIQFIQTTFAGLSASSILILLALGLSIVFGLMGVINMAHGEFMMIGAFTTYLVSEGFKHLPPGYYDYYLIAAIPAAFLVAGFAGWLTEILVIRHLYGRPLDTLLATWGVGLILIQFVRGRFGDSLTVTPPKWMEGGVEVSTDLFFALNRVYIVLFCGLCIVAVHILVNRTKFGLLLRATTQNREMAAALGVATRRMDAFTFAFGAGLAGLAGVAVPLYNKINPSIGQEYIVDSFMVVVVGGVGKLIGAIVAGLGIGFLGKYLETILSSFSAFRSSASVFGKVFVLGLIVLFLQYKPSGLFPPKGRNADA
jgi:urea transport system permease protein